MEKRVFGNIDLKKSHDIMYEFNRVLYDTECLVDDMNNYNVRPQKKSNNKQSNIPPYKNPVEKQLENEIDDLFRKMETGMDNNEDHPEDYEGMMGLPIYNQASYGMPKPKKHKIISQKRKGLSTRGYNFASNRPYENTINSEASNGRGGHLVGAGKYVLSNNKLGKKIGVNPGRYGKKY